MADYRATALVDDMLLRGYVPRGDSTYTLPVLLRLMSDELRGYVVDLLREAGGEHLVVPHTIEVAAGVTEYRLPHRAVANGVRRVSVVRPGAPDVQLPQLSPDDLARCVPGYMFRGPRLVLSPAPASSFTLRLDYLLRPSELVSTAYGTIASVVPSGDNVAITFTGTLGLADGPQRLDLVRALPPFDVLAVEAAGTLAGTTWTVPVASLLEVPEAGDYLCPPDTSPVACIPLEGHALLAQRVAWAVLSATSNAAAPAAYDRAEQMRAQCLSLLTPRDIGARHYVTGHLQRGGLGFARGRFR